MTISSHSDNEAEKPEAVPATDPNVIISLDTIPYNRLTRRSSQNITTYNQELNIIECTSSFIVQFNLYVEC